MAPASLVASRPIHVASILISFEPLCTGKAAGKDKKLFKEIESRFSKRNEAAASNVTDHEEESSWSSGNEYQHHHSPSSSYKSTHRSHTHYHPACATISEEKTLSTENEQVSAKLFYYLVSIMNMVFPDYDFR